MPDAPADRGAPLDLRHDTVPDAPADRGAPSDPSPEAVTSAWSERLRSFADDPPPPQRAQLRRTSAALRRIVHRLHGSAAPVDELSGMADELERLAAMLEGFPGGSLYEGFAESTLAGLDPNAFFDHSPMLGVANPLAPPISIRHDGDVIRATATFGSAYEGPPGCVHGGYIAAAFDEVLGTTQSLGGRPGMTGRLSVDYRSPTPLNTDLRFEGRVERVEGRKTFTVATLHAGDRLCAEAQGLFVAIDFEKMMELRLRRPEHVPPPPG